MRYLSIIIAILLISAVTPLCAQHIIAKQMPFFYQLSSNEIWDVYQDKEGYLWIGTTNGLARYDGYKLQFFRADYKSPNLLTNNSIVCMSDNDSYVWIGTRKGMNLFDKRTCRIIPFPEKTLQDKDIIGIIADKNTFTWIASAGKIYKCDSNAHIVKEYIISNSQDADHISTINSIYEDKKGNIWAIVTGSGPFRYNPLTDSFYSYHFAEGMHTPFVMYQDKSDNYWIGTWGEGLWQFFPDETGAECYKKHPVINLKDGQAEPIFFSITQDDAFGYLWALSYNELYALKLTPEGTLESVDIHDLLDTHMMYTRIFKDRDGNLWLSSYDMAYTIFFDESKIDNYPLPQLKERLGWDANILNLCLEEDVVWISQDRYGLCLYDLSRDKLSYNDINQYTGLPEASVLIKSRTKKGVWVGDRNASRVLRLTHQGLRIYIEEDVNLGRLVEHPGGIEQLIEDFRGNLWIFTSTHLFVKPSGEQSLIIVDKNLPRMSCSAMDMKGEVWTISSDHQIYRLTCSGNNIACESNARISRMSEQEGVRNMCIDKEGCIWLVSSLGRVYKSDKDKKTLENIALENEIEDSSVLNLLSDKDNVWIITNKKVIQYNIYQHTLSDYSTSDGNISVNVFRHRAVSMDGEGGLYVGGHGGFVHIRSGNDSLLKRNDIRPVITDVRVENRSIFFFDGRNKNKQVNTIDRISLSPDDRNIEIQFSSLQYSLDSKIRFAYKLEGVDRDWTYLDTNKHSVFYNQLSKGTHRFWLKLEYGQNEWTDGEVLLTIEKQPALYETWYALFFYIVCLGLCTYLVLRVYLRRIKKKNEIKFREELTQTKLDYFTNISHELLTPLTVMSCTMDYLEAGTSSEQKKIRILHSNVDRLKRLIQQILDFRKMDMGKMTLNVSPGNIGEFVLGICQTNFLPLAQKKNITLQTSVHPEDVSGYLDFDKVDKMLYNLLSNAIKYTSENKQIRVTVRTLNKAGRTVLVIEVEDEGIGISKKELEHIFTRFYNNRRNREIESNGIGLSLTKDLVILHRGDITVQSMPGKGTCFTVELPIDKDSYTADEIAVDITHADPEEIQPEEVISDEADKSTVLLVDDNTELLYLMKEMFEARYHVVMAVNGHQAWDRLNNYAVDMVVCDVMMPDMNGWELCRKIKTDLQFSHIPVIILTAKNGIDDRIASYEAGADGYVAKPFELKVLTARIDNLIKSYKIRQFAFQKEQDVSLESMTHQSADKEFLQSVIDSIEQHLEESEFDLELLATDLNMSKSTLYRKIKSITGLTPLDFIRNVKMKRACMMLLAKRLTISEVAYAVGFSNPKYFTKCFKDEFGITPSEYQQTHS